ncbi:hypothetical protein [Pedobacter panaciterrae]
MSVSYTLFSDLVNAKNERYFKFTLQCNERERIDDFYKLSKLLEKLFVKLSSEVSVNVLWNDIARQYAIEGYSLLNEVENLLRRLIANFMLINVGYDWHKLHIPSEVERRDPQLKVNYSDYLHQTYFSDLKTILFEGQREPNYRNIGDIQILVEKNISEGKDEIKIEDLKGVIAKSLWERHFSNATLYKKKNLEEDLERLNSLRNEIAHNRHIDRETLGKIQNISKKIIETLKLAIENLPDNILTNEEKDFQASSENLRQSTVKILPSEVAKTILNSNLSRLRNDVEKEILEKNPDLLDDMEEFYLSFDEKENEWTIFVFPGEKVKIVLNQNTKIQNLTAEWFKNHLGYDTNFCFQDTPF